MKIFFADKLPENRRGKYAHYEHKNLKQDGWTYCDIKGYIKKNQDHWLHDLDSWHAELSKVSLEFTQWWWLTNASRLYLFHSQELKPLFFAIAVIQYCHLINDNEIYLVRCPNDVGRYIKEIRPEAQIYSINDDSYLKTIAINSVKVRLILCKNQIINLVIIFLKNIKVIFFMLKRLLLKAKNTIGDKYGYKLFVYSNVINTENYINRGDYYFGNMFENMYKIPKKEILRLYWGGYIKKRKDFKQYLGAKNYRYVILEELLTLLDIVKILRVCLQLANKLRLIRKNLPILTIGKYQIRIYPRTFYDMSMKNEIPTIKFIIYFTMKKLLRHCTANVMIYPYEEHGFERAILRACTENNKSMLTVGYHHGVHYQSHIFYRNRPPDLINPPRPKIIAVIGPAEKKWFIESAKVEPSRVTVTGYGRYAEPVYLGIDHKDRQSRLKVLILTGFGSELIMLSNYIEYINDLFENCDVIIRKKPYARQGQASGGISRLKRLSKNIQIGTGSLMDQLRWCDVAIYCVTSAGIEAMLIGRLAIYVDLSDIIFMDPLHDKGDTSKVIRCFSPAQLKYTLERVRRMNSEEYFIAVQKQREFASQIFVPVNEENIATLIDINNIRIETKEM